MGKVRVSNVGDVGRIVTPERRDVQVAMVRLLEMTGPGVVRDGVRDTAATEQGPARAIAAGAATVPELLRPLDGQTGQTRRQVDRLQDLGIALGRGSAF